MSTTQREVREDQHGTVTGYAYGCRCGECRTARREWAKAHPTTGPKASAEMLDRVYEALEHEADMDGIVTATGARIGELVGISQHHVSVVVHELTQSGRVRIVGTVGVNVNEIHLIDGDS